MSTVKKAKQNKQNPSILHHVCEQVVLTVFKSWRIKSAELHTLPRGFLWGAALGRLASRGGTDQHLVPLAGPEMRIFLLIKSTSSVTQSMGRVPHHGGNIC